MLNPSVKMDAIMKQFRYCICLENYEKQYLENYYVSKRKAQTLICTRQKVKQPEILQYWWDVKCTAWHMENDLGVSIKVGQSQIQ